MNKNLQMCSYLVELKVFSFLTNLEKNLKEPLVEAVRLKSGVL